MFPLQNYRFLYFKDPGGTIYLVARYYFRDWSKTLKYGPIGTANEKPSININILKLDNLIRKKTIELEEIEQIESNILIPLQ